MKDNDQKQGRPSSGRIRIEKIGRREFVAQAGIAVCGAALVGVPASRALAEDPVIDFVKSSCGKDGPRILVGYASSCGSTGEIAKAIGDKLCAAGARADVMLMKEVEDATAYDGFVLGSAIHAGLWLNDGVKFILANQGVLKDAPVAYFVACMAKSGGTPESDKMAEGYLKHPMRVAPRVKPFAKTAFAGAVDYAKMPKKYHAIMRRINPEDVDARDWDAIAAWAESIAPGLLGK